MSAIHLSPFASSFDDPEHADVRLNVYSDTAGVEPSAKRTRTSARSAKATTPPVARSYHCHSVILAAQSGYFKAQLSSTWRQQSITPGGSAATRVVDLHAEAEELDAIHELLKMMYSLVLPEAAAATKPLFLQCLNLADRLEAVSCMELLITGATALPDKDVDAELLRRVFQASPGVCTSPSYPALLASCVKALVRLFGEVPAVIKDKVRKQQFCSLPYAAVLAWVKSDELLVDSENCVVFLVSAWVKANQDSTAAQREQLAHQIRVFHLGPAYLLQILPKLSWFRNCSGMQHLPAVLSCIYSIRVGTVDSCSTSEAGATMQQRVLRCVDCPPQWMAKSRLSAGDSWTGSWVMSPSQLKQVASGQMISLPSPVYVNGFMLKAQVQQCSAASAPRKTMGLFVAVDVAATSQQGVPLTDRAVVQMKAVKGRVGRPGYLRSKSHTVSRGRLLSGIRGKTDFLRASAAGFQELVAQYLQKGRLHIEITFSGVDEAY